MSQLEVSIGSKLVSLVPEFLIGSENLLAAILSAANIQEHSDLREWAEDGGEIKGFSQDNPEGNLIIPRDKIGRFYDLVQSKGGATFEIFDPSSNKAIGARDIHLNPDGAKNFGSEYVNVVYRGPKHEKDADGSFSGSEIPGSDLEEKLIVSCAEQVNREYIQEKQAEILSNPALNTEEANQVFDNVEVTMIEGLSSSEADLLQELSSRKKIVSFMMQEQDGTYALEYDAEDLARQGFPAHLTVGEELLSDYSIVVSSPQIKDYLDQLELNRGMMAFNVEQARLGKETHDITCVSLNGINMDCTPERVEIHGTSAEYFQKGDNGELGGMEFELTDPDQYLKFNNIFSTRFKDYQVMDTAEYDSIYQDRDEDIFDSRITRALSVRDGYLMDKENILSAAEELRKGGKSGLGISEDASQSGYRMIETRIPESDKVIAGTISEVSSIDVNQEELLHNMMITENSLKVSNRTHTSVPSFRKKDHQELAIDRNAVTIGSALYQDDRLKSLSPAEMEAEVSDQCAAYNQATAEPTEAGRLAWYEDKNHDGKDDKYQTESELSSGMDPGQDFENKLDEPGNQNIELGDGYEEEFDWEHEIGDPVL